MLWADCCCSLLYSHHHVSVDLHHWAQRGFDHVDHHNVYYMNTMNNGHGVLYSQQYRQLLSLTSRFVTMILYFILGIDLNSQDQACCRDTPSVWSCLCTLLLFPATWSKRLAVWIPLISSCTFWFLNVSPESEAWSKCGRTLNLIFIKMASGGPLLCLWKDFWLYRNLWINGSPWRTSKVTWTLNKAFCDLIINCAIK